jgi:hypothetical protein
MRGWNARDLSGSPARPVPVQCFAAVVAREDAPREAGGDDGVRVEGIDGDHLAEVAGLAVADEVGLFGEQAPGLAAVPGAVDEAEALAAARLARAAEEDLGVVRT